jgi:hypothetical protein
MVKLKLIMCFLLLDFVSFADNLSLTNGYDIENVELINELIDSVRYRGMDIEISLAKDQIQSRQFETYDPLKPSRFILYYKKTYENFYNDAYIRPDTVSQMKITMVHGETIRGNLTQNMASLVVIQADYGLITIAKNLIIDPVNLGNTSFKVKNMLTVTMLNGESFDGEQISSTDSSIIFRTNIGNINILKSNIVNISNAMDNKTFLLGDTFAIQMADGQSFNGLLLSSTDSTETYQAEIGILTVSKRSIKKSIMTFCGDPLDNKFLLFGNSFIVATLNGELFDGKLISSTDSTLTYQKDIDSITVLKRNIMTVLNTSLDNKSFKTKYSSTITLINKESFHGKRISSTDSTEIFQTNIGNVVIHKRNILAVDNTLKDVVYQIKDAGIHLPPLLSIYGGTAIPTGDYAKVSATDGGAQTGFTAGVQFVTGGRIGLLLDVSYTYNETKTDVIKDDVLKEYLERQYGRGNVSVGNLSSGNWNNILFLAGLKIGTKNLNGTNYFIAPIVGMDFATTPKLSDDYSGSYFSTSPLGSVYNTFAGHVTQASSSGIAFVYGATAGIIISDRYTINARYIHGELNYDLSNSDNSSVSIKQNISIFQIFVGIVL